jgi:lysyl-tRNA synthetase class 1
VAALTDAQRAALGALADTVVAEAPVAGDAWQDLIFRTAQASGISSGEAFAAIYAAFLGRANGPRAGWLLASLDPDFTVERLRAAAAAAASPPAADVEVRA